MGITTTPILPTTTTLEITTMGTIMGTIMGIITTQGTIMAAPALLCLSVTIMGM